MLRIAVATFVVCLALGSAGPNVRAVDGWPEVSLEPYGPEFAFITELAAPHDGSGRLYVVEKRGTVRVLEPGGAPAPGFFLDIRDRVGADDSEQGLLGLAFAPGFPDNPALYVNYTDLNGDTVVSRFEASALDADEATEDPILGVEQPASNHNGGHIAFGPDGWLYIGMGDGGGAGDPDGHAQRDGDLLGKLLRYNPGTGAVEQWAKGLRNPWKFSFDRATGDLYIADVGQNAWEEVHVSPAGTGPGLNYGWDRMEGSHCFPAGSTCDPTGLQLPVAEYSHDEGCSITGGFVSRGGAPSLEGIYVFSDYCTGSLWGLRRGAEDRWERGVLGGIDANVSTFGEAENGDLFVAARNGPWRVYRLTVAESLPDLPFRQTLPGLATDR